MENRCVSCGEIIPEGGQVCMGCKYGYESISKRKERNDNMKKLLVIVDMQIDFINGELENKEAMAVVPKIIDKIDGWDGDIIYTQDTHFENYLETNEGKHLPVEHCIKDEIGWLVDGDIMVALNKWTHGSSHSCRGIEKYTFGSTELAEDIYFNEYDYVELVGVCTDICVVSNALLIKTFNPEIDVVVDASCCAGVTPDSHKAALLTMKMCQVDILKE